MAVKTAKPSPKSGDARQGPSSEDARAYRRAQRTAASLAKLGLGRNTLPNHVAIIMDGNGRWASDRNKPRTFGHEQGAKSVRAIVEECARLQLEVLTLYSFSSENWIRPAEEVHFLMDLYADYLVAERQTMMENDVRFLQIGRRQGLSASILHQLDLTRRLTANNGGLTLVLALNYGSRTEITDAVRGIAEKVKNGDLDPADIQEQTITDHLYTAGLPDPDLLIRTASEMRVSNYLLWQISYAELYVAEVCWPDFNIDQFHKALHAYAARKRKFGGVAD